MGFNCFYSFLLKDFDDNKEKTLSRRSGMLVVFWVLTDKRKFSIPMGKNQHSSFFGLEE